MSNTFPLTAALDIQTGIDGCLLQRRFNRAQGRKSYQASKEFCFGPAYTPGKFVKL